MAHGAITKVALRQKNKFVKKAWLLDHHNESWTILLLTEWLSSKYLEAIVGACIVERPKRQTKETTKRLLYH